MITTTTYRGCRRGDLTLVHEHGEAVALIQDRGHHQLTGPIGRASLREDLARMNADFHERASAMWCGESDRYGAAIDAVRDEIEAIERNMAGARG